MARGQGDFGEGPQLFFGPHQPRFHIGHVKLDHFLAGAAARVGDIHADLDGFAILTNGQVGIGERRIRQAMTKGEEDRHVLGVVIAIAHKEPFAIEDFAVLAGIVEIGGVVRQSLGEGGGQTARRVNIPKEDVGDGVARFLARVPRLHHSGHIVHPGQGDR